MSRKRGNEFTNDGFNEFQKQTGNILNHVETFLTFDALDNVLSGYGPGCNVPSVHAPLASCYSRITGLYLDVFRKCSGFCGVKSQRECNTTFRVINRTEDARLYLDVYRKYSRVSGKVPCSSAFVGGVGDGLDKRKLQTESLRLSMLSCLFWQSCSVCGLLLQFSCRSFHAYPNAVMITVDSQHSCPVSQDGGNTQENCQLRLVAQNELVAAIADEQKLTNEVEIERFSEVQTEAFDNDIGVGISRDIGLRIWLYDVISRGERDGYEVGGRIILPMSFTGGPRYMYAHYLDALAIFRKLGNPQFFIIFTCNVNWPKIKRFMSEYPHLTASDRAYVVCRVFEQKIQALIAFLKEERIFGDVTGVLYTVEFQKRGLPHCHTLFWVDSASRIRIAEDADRFISAELPDPRIDPEGYNVVSELMVYGPCIAASVKAPCMKGDKCSKKFPKKFNQKTFFDENGHVHYQRRDTSVSTTRNEFQLDNSYVVSYNRNLLLAFRTHINVEYCGWSMLIKYLFKYISKGTDRVFTRMSRPIGESSTVATPSRQVIDEIQNYVEGRFICSHEAYRRILKFDIHRREPTVHILAMHLEDMQRITFRDQDRLKSVIDLPRKKSTTLIEWFAFNEANEVGRHLSYLEFPSEFVWYSDRKSWSSRKTSKSSIGRLT
ncbi:DNA helicase, partial [Tanacetum coccineum]